MHRFRQLFTLFILCLGFFPGFEGCSMVPTIYPLETLHNSLSLRQVNEFLTAVCRSCSESHAQSTAGTDGVGSFLGRAEQSQSKQLRTFGLLHCGDRLGNKHSH